MSEDLYKNLNIKEVLKILPHRYPFLLVDKIHEVNLKEGTILAQKNVSINESFFQGHFPGSPIMPGVLILEALAQTGGILVYLKGESALTTIALLMNVKNAKFRKPVHPGDILILNCEGLHFSSKGGRVRGIASVNGEVAVEAEMGFAIAKREDV